jgi:hypothetical protein
LYANSSSVGFFFFRSPATITNTYGRHSKNRLTVGAFLPKHSPVVVFSLFLRGFSFAALN